MPRAESPPWITVVHALHIFRSRRFGVAAGTDPWAGPTLEWLTTSPPRPYAFARLPTVRGREALWTRTADTPEVTGLEVTKREVLNTTVVDAQPEHRYQLCEDSLWPFLLAVVTGVTFTALLFHPIAFVLGLGAAFLVLLGWFWRGNEPKRLSIESVRSLPLETQP